MKSVSYTDARKRLAGLIKTVAKTGDPVTLTREGKGIAVLVSTREYSSMTETLHLHSTQANSERIHQGLREYSKMATKLGKRRKTSIRRTVSS